jgi:hypothetical protein
MTYTNIYIVKIMMQKEKEGQQCDLFAIDKTEELFNSLG